MTSWQRKSTVWVLYVMARRSLLSCKMLLQNDASLSFFAYFCGVMFVGIAVTYAVSDSLSSFLFRLVCGSFLSLSHSNSLALRIRGYKIFCCRSKKLCTKWGIVVSYVVVIVMVAVLSKWSICRKVLKRTSFRFFILLRPNLVWRRNIINVLYKV